MALRHALSIRTKLYAALFAAVLLVTLTLLFFLQFSVTSFRNVLEDMDARLVERVARRLEHQYARAPQDDWRFLGSGLAEWLRWNLPPDAMDFPPPTAVRQMPVESMPLSLQRPAGPPPAFAARLVLRDTQGAVVAGPLADDEPVLRIPLQLDTREIGTLELLPQRDPPPVPFGWGGLPPPAPAVDEHGLLSGTRFMTLQSRVFLTLVLASIVVVLLFGLPLARHLTRRIDTLSSAAARLGEGDFDTRLPAGGSDELAHLATSFNHLAEALSKNRKSQQVWMGNISHELRTPLGILKGELEAVQDGVRQADPDQIALLYGEVTQLERLVDDLCVLSMSDLGGLGYRKCMTQIIPVLEDSMARFREQLHSKSLTLNSTFVYDVAPRLYGDPQRLLQLFSNLIQNSIKYTAAHGEIHVTLVATGSRIDVTVEDSAPGVRDEHLPRLFDRFFRAEESRNRSTGGAGLGLALCRSIAQAHQGTIEASHSPLGGVRILLSLPRDP